MKLHRSSKAVFLLPILSVVIAASMTSCNDPGPGVRPGYASVGTQHGYAARLSRGYSGDTYHHGNQYYTGGRYEAGSFNYQGRRYNGRYLHNGRYYYGGQYVNQGDGSRYAANTRANRNYHNVSSGRTLSGNNLPRGYSGDVYRHGGYDYYKGSYERGSYIHQGRRYNERYFHDGRYLYGGNYVQVGSHVQGRSIHDNARIAPVAWGW